VATLKTGKYRLKTVILLLQGQLLQIKGYKVDFLLETISMRPLSPSSGRLLTPAGADDDTDETVSWSDSSDEQADPPVLQQLAAALIAWEPTLIAAYARLDQASAQLAPFAAFLARLDKEVGKKTAIRGEIVGWLQRLVTDDAARSRAFQLVGTAEDAATALAIYQSIRAAGQ
jgi:hypothetical protein